MDLTEAQWEKLKPLLAPKRRSDGRGRPWRDTQAVLNGVLWVLRTGAPWHDLPDRYPPYQTCHRRFQQWQRDGTLDRLLHALAEDLRTRGKLDLSETFIDASFSSAKKGALLSARLAEEKAVKSWRSQTAMVFLSPAASPALRPRQTKTNDRRPRLRQRSARSAPPAKTRHPAHRAPQVQPPPQEYPGRPRTTPLLPALENRAPLCLAPQFPPTRQPLGISRGKISRNAPARLSHYPPEAFMRWLLN